MIIGWWWEHGINAGKILERTPGIGGADRSRWADLPL